MIYTPSSYRWDVAILIFSFVVDFCRIEIGMRGNVSKHKHEGTLQFSSLLIFPSILSNVFFLRFQNFV